jgi:hypothetical protein
VFGGETSDFPEYLGTELRIVVKVPPDLKFAPSERALNEINGQFTKNSGKVTKAGRRASDQTVK